MENGQFKDSIKTVCYLSQIPEDDGVRRHRQASDDGAQHAEQIVDDVLVTGISEHPDVADVGGGPLDRGYRLHEQHLALLFGVIRPCRRISIVGPHLADEGQMLLQCIRFSVRSLPPVVVVFRFLLLRRH